jgi:hypothetical protein
LLIRRQRQMCIRDRGMAARYRFRDAEGDNLTID